MIAWSKYQFAPLDNTNYFDWVYAQRMDLTKKKLWAVTDGSEPKLLGSPNSNAVKGWVRRDEEALATIVSNILPSQYHLTQNATSTKEAWDNIKSYHTTEGLGSIVAMWRQLIRLKKAGEEIHMRDHIGDIQMIIDKLKALGKTCTDRLAIAFIMESLPHLYNNLIVALDNNPQHTDLSYVISHILNEETHQSKEKTESPDHLALASNFSRSHLPIDHSTIICHGCGQKGHFKNECGTFPFNQITMLTTSMAALAIGSYDEEIVL